MGRMFYQSTPNGVCHGLSQIKQLLIHRYGFVQADGQDYLVKNNVQFHGHCNPFEYQYDFKDAQDNFDLDFTTVWYKHWDIPFGDDGIVVHYNDHFPLVDTMQEGSQEQVFYFLEREIAFIYQVHPEILTEGRMSHLKPLYPNS